MKSERHKSCITRLRRVEGQVRGIQRMIEEDRYCIDILTQMQAVKAAFKKVEDELLKGHAEACVQSVIESGDPVEQREKFSELIDLFGKANR